MREGYPEFRTKGAPCNEFTRRNRQKTTKILSVPFLILVTQLVWHVRS